MKEQSVNIKYWFKLYELELILLRFVKSLRTLDFELFVSSLGNMVPWMFSMTAPTELCWCGGDCVPIADA